MSNQEKRHRGLTRRELLVALTGTGAIVTTGALLFGSRVKPPPVAETFIGRVPSYDVDMRVVISRGLDELGISRSEIKDRRILLKPNLVETHGGAPHINTHPTVLLGAVEAFLSLGAARVYVGEGPGHRRDTLDVLEESGVMEVLYENRVPFLDLNYQDGMTVRNLGGESALATLTFPRVFRDIDWVVSVAKMKTHHWTGATLSMKNLFGVMPGIYYGWPKNVLHHAGIENAILDITATLKPNFAIVDGVIGMEGDGPIMGTPVAAGVIVMGRSLPAVDATCCRIMKIDPDQIEYLRRAADWLGPIEASRITQRGEPVRAVQKRFALLDHIPAQKDIRLPEI